MNRIAKLAETYDERLSDDDYENVSPQKLVMNAFQSGYVHAFEDAELLIKRALIAEDRLSWDDNLGDGARLIHSHCAMILKQALDALGALLHSEDRKP